ncbi:hypothetical protein DL770_004882 [Monosporascus sp. CRB-9-2]|nr:hypothetical protein DL770_004882 [Monosporascus sp. CRB-9-2]
MRRPRTSTALHQHDGCAKAAAKANQACHSCKRQKRKCDKALPSCGLCSRMSRTCDYSDVPPAPTAEDIMSLQLKLLELESRLSISSGSDGSLGRLDPHNETASHQGHTPRLQAREPLWESSLNVFPSTAFLDARLFRRVGLSIPRPLCDVPQALILVALYEYGQGIYPAAWMTVGQCVRYADFIGLPSYQDSNNILGQCGTWIEMEERRRTWWAVYILDKLVAIGSRKRPLSTEPSANEMLPVADSAFDAGDISAAVQGTVSAPFTEPQSPFSRLCQGAMLVSRALDHARRVELRKLNGELGDAVEVGNLADSACSLFVSIQGELVAQPAAYFSLMPAQCMALSATTTTLSMYAAGDAQVGDFPTAGISGLEGCEDGLSLHMTALEGLRKTAARARELARDLLAMTVRDEEAVKTSPLILGAVYSAAAEAFLLAAPALESSWKDSSNGGDDLLATTTTEAARKCLARLSPRWRLAGEYLRALDHLEVVVVLARTY